MQRVSSEEEGYDFSKITHGHWKENTPITQYLLIILILPAPTIIYNLIIWTTHDFLIAHIVYQTLLIFLIIGYHFSISKLNFDVYYIHEVRNVNVQIRKGIIRMILFAVIIPAIFVLLKYLNLKQANHIELLIPGGIEPKSIFPKILHIIYMTFFFIEFCLFMPLVEFRYYFVFIQYRINTFCTSFWIFIFMFLNNLYFIYHLLVNDKHPEIVLTYFIAVLLMYVAVFVARKNYGIITALLQQMGIHLGVFLVITLMLFTKSIVDDPKNPEMFSNRNIFDFTFQIFFNKDEKEL